MGHFAKVSLVLAMGVWACGSRWSAASPDDAGLWHAPPESAAQPTVRLDAVESALPPAEAFARQQAVLAHFQADEETAPSTALASLAGRQTESGLRALLAFFDRSGRFGQFSQLSSERVEGFQDFISRKVSDYSVKLASGSPVSGPLFQAPADRPLQGLRVVLDPGHMGGDLWDGRTGKFVRDPQGHKISEGVIALQTALLLEKELEALGATVLLTRRGLRPVTDTVYEQLNLVPYARLKLAQSSLSDWFRGLLASAPAGDALNRVFETDGRVKNIFSESQRAYYFIFEDELEARVRVIEAFHPDITVIIHYDTSDPPGNPSGLNPTGYDATKVFVAGGFMADEFATRQQRAEFARHVLDQQDWEQSLSLSREVVHSLRDTLKIPFDRSGGDNNVAVEPGVLARNLHLNRKLSGHAVTYVECLFYNDPKEFRQLLDARHPMEIDGVSRPYSDRLVTVAQGLRDGVVAFATHHLVRR